MASQQWTPSKKTPLPTLAPGAQDHTWPDSPSHSSPPPLAPLPDPASPPHPTANRLTGSPPPLTAPPEQYDLASSSPEPEPALATQPSWQGPAAAAAPLAKQPSWPHQSGPTGLPGSYVVAPAAGTLPGQPSWPGGLDRQPSVLLATAPTVLIKLPGGGCGTVSKRARGPLTGAEKRQQRAVAVAMLSAAMAVAEREAARLMIARSTKVARPAAVRKRPLISLTTARTGNTVQNRTRPKLTITPPAGVAVAAGNAGTSKTNGARRGASAIGCIRAATPRPLGLAHMYLRGLSQESLPADCWDDLGEGALARPDQRGTGSGVRTGPAGPSNAQAGAVAVAGDRVPDLAGAGMDMVLGMGGSLGVSEAGMSGMMGLGGAAASEWLAPGAGVGQQGLEGVQAQEGGGMGKGEEVGGEAGDVGEELDMMAALDAEIGDAVEEAVEVVEVVGVVQGEVAQPGEAQGEERDGVGEEVEEEEGGMVALPPPSPDEWEDI